MNRPFFATKPAPNLALLARVGVACVVLVGGICTFSPSTASTLRWTVGKVGVRIKRLITPGPGNFPVCAVAEVAAGGDVGLLDVSEFSAGDWPGWRGIAADNCAATADCPTVWSEAENVAWRVSLPGKGHASPLVVGERIFVTTAEEDSGRVLAMALEKETGREIWRRTIAEGTFRSIHEFNSHASSTPVCDGQNLYVAALTENSVHLSALSVESGEVLWTKFCGPCTAKWGFSGSLAFWCGLVYVVVDNPEGGWIAAFGTRQGEVAWLNRRAPAQEGSYSSPIVARIHDVPQIVVAGAETITAFQPESGAILWNYQGIPSCCASTVVAADDLCYAGGGWPDRKLACIRVNRAAESDTWAAEMLWETDKASEAPYVPTPLYHDGKLYVVHDQGVVMCRDATSGKIAWKRRLEGNFNASPTLIGDHLLVANDVGVSALLDLASGKVVARNSLPAGLHASPVASGSCLLLKTDEQLYCIGSPRIAKR